MTAHRIDVQHHALPPEYVAAIGAEPIARLIVSGRLPDWSPQVSLEAMDRNGIATAMMSLSAPGIPSADRAALIALSRGFNLYVARMKSDHRGRFGLFAALPLPDIDASLAEIAHAYDELGAEGVCLLTNYDGIYLGDARFAPIFEEMDRRHAVVHVHPTEAAGPQPLPLLPAATLEFPFETTRAIASLLFSGAMERYRNVRFVFSHAGGAAPFLAERIARLERRPDLRAQVPSGVLANLQRCYFDIALSANPFAFSALTELVGMDRILFASDFPFAPEETMAGTVKGLGALGLAAEDLAAIERGNALRLMPGLAAISDAV